MRGSEVFPIERECLQSTQKALEECWECLCLMEDEGGVKSSWDTLLKDTC